MTIRLQIPKPRALSGRPESGEFADYARADIDLVFGDDAVSALAASAAQTFERVSLWTDDSVRGVTYAPGKWTVKEVLGHLVDDERIFAYRALVVARGDTVELPGFDEELYVRSAAFEERALTSLIAEYRSVRQSSLDLFAGLSQTQLTRRRVVNGYPASPRGLAFHIAGHELHHLRILNERYLPQIRSGENARR